MHAYYPRERCCLSVPIAEKSQTVQVAQMTCCPGLMSIHDQLVQAK